MKLGKFNFSVWLVTNCTRYVAYYHHFWLYKIVQNFTCHAITFTNREKATMAKMVTKPSNVALFRTVIVLLCQVINFVFFVRWYCKLLSWCHISSVTCRLLFFSCFETMRNVMSQHSKYWGSLKIGGKLNSSISTVQVVSLSSFTYIL